MYDLYLFASKTIIVNVRVPHFPFIYYNLFKKKFK